MLTLSFAHTASRADLPSPRFDRLTPLGAAAGSRVEVEIAGADIEDVKSLLFDHPGLKAEHLKERRFRVTVAADVPTGTYDVRLVGRFGVSNPRLFAVSHGLTEVMEKEPNDEAASAQGSPSIPPSTARPTAIATTFPLPGEEGTTCRDRDARPASSTR